jgi:hypothetical protein
VSEPDDPQGFTYWVEDEILIRFAESTPLQRLRWLEEMRTFTWNAATEETRARWRSARERDRGAITALLENPKKPSASE